MVMKQGQWGLMILSVPFVIVVLLDEWYLEFF